MSSKDLLREAAALAYVADLDNPELDANDARHFAISLRLRAGELVVVSDGAGRFRGCRVASVSRGEARRSGSRAELELFPDGPVESAARSGGRVGVGFSIAKGERTEWAVAKLAELGVDRIIPLVCARTVVRPGAGDGAAHKLDRLRRILRESAMQARLVFAPVLLDPMTPSEAAVVLGHGTALAEPGGAAPSLATSSLLVGPEGGWAPEELELGLPEVSLGNTILRVETAAVVAGALLTALRAGLVSSSGTDAGPV